MENLEALMKLSLSGDRRAYAVLLQETARFLRPFLAKRLNFGTEVDDLLQEILLSIHKARHTYDGERPYKPGCFINSRDDRAGFLICPPPTKQVMETAATMASNHNQVCGPW